MNKFLRVVSTLALLTWVGGAFSTPVTQTAVLSKEDVSAWLDGQVEKTILNQDLAGLSVSVVKDGEVLISKGYGYSDVASKTALDGSNSLVRAGSVSKLFTWIAVMQLVERGLINLDRDINYYLDFKLPERSDGALTMRALMSHKSGFEEVARGIIAKTAEDAMSLENWLKASVPQRVFAVDEKAAYSNYAAGLAGYVVERMSGMHFEDYIEKHIFSPLGMNTSTFKQPLPESIVGKMAKSYDLASKPQEYFEIIQPAPAGSLSSTAEDMAKFMAALMSDDAELKVLKKETRSQMWDFESHNLPSMQKMSLGFFRSDRNGYKILSHGGDTQFFHSNLVLIPSPRVGLFISISGTGKEFYAAKLRVDLTNGFIDRYFPNMERVEPKTLDPENTRERAIEISGFYQGSRASFSSILSLINPLSQIKIAVNQDNHLVIDEFKNGSGQVWHWQENEPYIWQQIGGTTKLSFAKDTHGIWQFSVDSLSPAIQWSKVEGMSSGGLWLPILFLSISIIALQLLATVFRMVSSYVYKINKETIKGLTTFRMSSLLFVIAILVLISAFSTISKFDNPDALIRLSQFLILMSSISAYISGCILLRYFSNTKRYTRLIFTLIILLSYSGIITYLTLFNFWSTSLAY